MSEILPQNEDPARRVFRAQYERAELDTWQDNPLIEALPGLLTDEEFAEVIRFFPPHHEEMSEHPKHLRLMYIQRCLQFFMPMEKHMLLYQRFARIVRDGYVNRNPVTDIGWSRLPKQLNSINKKLKYGVERYEPPSTLGFAIIGIGGIGKTTGVNSILRTYPKMLIHHSYTDSQGRSHSLMRTQIIFVKIDCPSDGTLQTLCLKFFENVDKLTGYTRYYYDYGHKGSVIRSEGEMLPDMARVAALHSIGLLIIDEIQFLAKRAPEEREEMLQWFTELVNEMKIPVVLIGTPRADSILNAAFWQMRRNAGQGEGDWRRMAKDEEWERFLRSLWRYQFVKHRTELLDLVKPDSTNIKLVPPELSETLYEESQGIADFAVKMFMISQERAINSGLERITPELIKLVAKQAFGKARVILQAIKDNDDTALARVDDVEFDIQRAKQQGKTPVPPAQKTASNGSNKTQPSQSEQTSVVSQDGDLTTELLNLFKASLTSSSDSLQGLREAGYIKSPTEFGV